MRRFRITWVETARRDLSPVTITIEGCQFSDGAVAFVTFPRGSRGMHMYDLGDEDGILNDLVPWMREVEFDWLDEDN